MASQSNRRRGRRDSFNALDGCWPSHTPFYQMIDYSIDGNAQNGLKAIREQDHVAELCMLLYGDVDTFLWYKRTANKEGIKLRRLIDTLTGRIRDKNDLAAAKTLYAVATYAAFEVLRLYLRQSKLFDLIAPRRTLLPCLSTIHPNTAKVMAAMRENACLGTLTLESHTIGSRAWYTSNAPANIYARTIINGIELNQNLEPIDVQKKSWARFDKINRCKTRLLPLPTYIDGIDRLPVPISPECVLQYWRKGKEIILEEMPDFHSRPEWRNYRRRHYKTGAKRGAIQHAIFKDILTALRSIAGASRRR